MTPRGIEPLIPAWEASVLTAWPRSLIYIRCLVFLTANINITYVFTICKYFFNFFIKILLFRLFVWSDIKFIIHYLNYFVNFYFSFWLCSLTVPLYNTRIFYLCQIFLFLFFCILKEPYFKVFLLFYKALFYFIFLMIFLILPIFLCKHPLLFGVNLFWSYLLLHLLILLLDIYFFLLLRS